MRLEASIRREINEFDGVEIDYKDLYTFEQGSAEKWLIDFTKRLRELLPSHKIIHTVESRLLRPSVYPNGGYIKINAEIGQMIDFYNIRFFGNANSSYLTYDDLFIKAPSSYANTSVKEISQQGFSLDKIVVGKTTVAGVSGAVTDGTLRDWANKARQDLGWNAGFWLGELVNDLNGSSILTALSLLRNQSSTANTSNNQTNTTTNSTNTNATSNITSNTTSNTTINTNISTTNSTIPYPVYFVYVNSVSAWWGD
jgi:hypothetical protein